MLIRKQLANHQGSERIDATQFSNGVYVVNLNIDGNRVETKKLVIQH